MNSNNLICEVYLEGVQVSFNSISINEAVGRTPEATINFPVTASITTMLPKTICQVFCSEFDPTAKEDKDRYRMVEIFQGEFSKFSFSGDFDKRSIQALFRGFSQNFNNACVIPIDTNLISQVLDKATQIILAEDREVVVKHNLLSNTSALSQLAAMEKTMLPSVIINTIIDNYARNAYFSSIYKLFGIKDQIYFADPKDANNSELLQMLKIMSGSQLLNKAGITLSQTAPLGQFLNQLLAEIGFEMQELAAPSNGHRILVKPDTTFFEPIKCNTIFNSDIAAMQFSRDYDAEPTRAIRSTPLIRTPTMTEMETLIMSVVVPAGIVTGKAIDAADKDTLSVLGFTPEERLRGVLLDHIGPSTMATDYMMAAAQNIGVVQDVAPSMAKLFAAMGKDPSTALSMANELAKTIAPGDKQYIVKNLHVALAQIAWLHRRQENRVCNITTPYNPYRLVGFTGTIITTGMPTMVGMLHSISTQISADGAAHQSLTYTHCMYYDSRIQVTSIDNLINQDLIELTPPWYSDYTGPNSESFYKDITGFDGKNFRNIRAIKNNSSEWVEPIKYILKDTVRDAITIFKEHLALIEESGTYDRYIYEHTRRKLKPKQTSITALAGTPRDIKAESAADARTIPVSGQTPFIIERQQRVLDIFVPAGLVSKEEAEAFNYIDTLQPINFT